jgi:hypothetical protein
LGRDFPTAAQVRHHLRGRGGLDATVDEGHDDGCVVVIGSKELCGELDIGRQNIMCHTQSAPLLQPGKGQFKPAFDQTGEVA